jgi:hypothetical protein
VLLYFVAAFLTRVACDKCDLNAFSPHNTYIQKENFSTLICLTKNTKVLGRQSNKSVLYQTGCR